MIRMLRFVLSVSRLSTLAAMTLSIASGILSMLVLAEIGRSIRDRQSNLNLIAVLAPSLFLSEVAGKFLMDRTVHKALFQLRSRLSRAVAEAPLMALERVGTGRLYSVLAEDLQLVSNNSGAAATALAQATTLAAAVIYLLAMAPKLMGVWLVIGVLLVAVVLVANASVARTLRLARTKTTELYESMKSLIEGAKEVRLNAALRDTFLRLGVDDVADDVRRVMVRADVLQSGTLTFARILFVVAVAATPWLSVVLHASAEVIATFGVTLLFLQGTVEMLIIYLRNSTRAEVALESIERLGSELRNAAVEESADRPPIQEAVEIELEDVSHSYQSAEAEGGFRMGPIDLSLRSGRVTFLVGANGSGKSTLAKIVSGLYTPEQGFVSVNGERVTAANSGWLRSHFAAVFADYHVFDPRFLNQGDNQALARDYLTMLKLSHKVTLADGVFSTQKLSTGQRKRLALVIACLQDRPAYLFDEWAADQDPVFRRVFYTAILPDLKRRGKLVVVVTHDDRYFHVADEVIKLDEGATQII